MTDQSVEPRASTQETREMLVSLYVRGAPNDAKAMYGASPGATDAGWQQLERMLTPVKNFIADGGTPYVTGLQTTEYAGIEVPADELTPSETKGSPSSWAEPGQPGAKPSEPQDPKRPAKPGSEIMPGVTTTESQTQSETVPAAELINRAKNADTMEELDEIEKLANGRVTVLDAITAREEELTKA